MSYDPFGSPSGQAFAQDDKEMRKGKWRERNSRIRIADDFRFSRT
jgi:hypothetical protein